MARQAESPITHKKILLLAVQAPYNKTTDINSYFEEFLNLAKTNGIDYDEVLHIRLREIESGTFLTKGKIQEVKDFVEKNGIQEIYISEPLTPQQERNLNDLLEVPINDRTQLILEIFQKAAHTAEGQTQVAIAMLRHAKTRLAGKGIFLEQQSGAIGVRAGSGETLKERETRVIEDKIAKLKKDLEKIHKTRETQRKRRLESGLPLLCLIGYTNAGKSTLLNALTKSNVLAEDKLFATLDTTTRELFIGGKKKGLLSDTVGFIQLLPPQLIEAFKSTLSELSHADLLIQVIDVSDPNWQDHIKVVNEILVDLGIDKAMLYVFNKIDKVQITPDLEQHLDRYQPHVLASALDKKGIESLLAFLDSWRKPVA